MTTSEDGFNIFRPNLDPEFEEEETADTKEESKVDSVVQQIKQAKDYNLDSDEDMEHQEKRLMATAK